jgi:uncharacterized NAD(P)/FAD-binding protein YdhS
VDALRSKTQEIWQHLPFDDKKMFLSHLRHLWGVARHRLPAHIHSEIQDLIRHKKLKIKAGKIINITGRENDGFSVRLRRRKDQSDVTLEVSRIINCTGPQTDIRKFESQLYKNLLKKGMVAPDELYLGLSATPDGRIIDAHGHVSPTIYTLGSLLKGILWETTAVPELRNQAKRTSEIILQMEDSERKGIEH